MVILGVKKVYSFCCVSVLLNGTQYVYSSPPRPQGSDRQTGAWTGNRSRARSTGHRHRTSLIRLEPLERVEPHTRYRNRHRSTSLWNPTYGLTYLRGPRPTTVSFSSTPRTETPERPRTDSSSLHVRSLLPFKIVTFYFLLFHRHSHTPNGSTPEDHRRSPIRVPR